MLITFPLAVTIAAAFTLMKPRVRRWFVWTIVPILWAFYASQIIFSGMYSTFWTLEMLFNNTGAVVEFIDITMTAVIATIPWTIFALTPAVGVIVYEYFEKREFSAPETMFSIKQQHVGWLLIISFALNAIIWISFIPAVYSPASSMGTFFGKSEKNQIVIFERSGFVGALGIQLTELIIPRGSDDVLDEIITLPPVQPPTPPQLRPPETNAETNDNDIPPLPFSPEFYNAFDIDFAALSAASSGRIQQAHNFFDNHPRGPSRHNQFTGMFEGHNVIFIVAESFTDYVVRPDLTPTLYHMMTNGIHATNFYNPQTNTIFGEITSMLGMHFVSGVTGIQIRTNPNLWLPFTLSRQFGMMGVQPHAFHNYCHQFYNRHILFPNMGYTWFACGNGMEAHPDITSPGFNSDLSMMQATIDRFINDDLFHIHYMTSSGHSPFTFAGNSMARRHRDAVAHLPYSDRARAYLASQLELELAVTYLLERLNEAGVAENTMIVIVPDHPPHDVTLNASEVSELRGRPVDMRFDAHRSGMILYVQGMQPILVERPVSNIDILPTVLNLLGRPFDSRMIMGIDILSELPSLVVFNDGFLTDNGWFFRTRNEFIPNAGITVPENYVRTIENFRIQLETISRSIVELNYFRTIEQHILNPQLLRIND
jgi:hypothetical protein